MMTQYKTFVKKYNELNEEQKAMRRMSWRAAALYLGTFVFGYIIGNYYGYLAPIIIVFFIAAIIYAMFKG